MLFYAKEEIAFNTEITQSKCMRLDQRTSRGFFIIAKEEKKKSLRACEGKTMLIRSWGNSCKCQRSPRDAQTSTTYTNVLKHTKTLDLLQEAGLFPALTKHLLKRRLVKKLPRASICVLIA